MNLIPTVIEQSSIVAFERSYDIYSRLLKTANHYVKWSSNRCLGQFDHRPTFLFLDATRF